MDQTQIYQKPMGDTLKNEPTTTELLPQSRHA